MKLFLQITLMNPNPMHLDSNQCTTHFAAMVVFRAMLLACELSGSTALGVLEAGQTRRAKHDLGRVLDELELVFMVNELTSRRLVEE